MNKYNLAALTFRGSYGYGVQRHFQQYISYTVVISIIGGGNQSTQRKRRPVTNFITQCYIEYTSPLAGLEFTVFVAICTGCTGSYKSNNHTITMTTARGSYVFEEKKLKMLHQLGCQYLYIFLIKTTNIMSGTVVIRSTEQFREENITFTFVNRFIDGRRRTSDIPGISLFFG